MKSLVEEVLILLRAPFVKEGGIFLQNIQDIGIIFTILLLGFLCFGVLLVLLWRRQHVLQGSAQSKNAPPRMGALA